MKGYLSALLFLVAIVTADGQECSSLNTRETRYIADRLQCDKYIQCAATNVQHSRYCSLGTLFDKNTKSCGHSKDVIANSACDTQYCANTNSRYRYADSCEVFYQCSEVAAGIKDITPKCCQSGLTFNNATGECQLATAGNECTAKLYAHPDSCRSYYQCDDGELMTQCCGQDMLFDPKMGECVRSTETDLKCSQPCVNDVQPKESCSITSKMLPVVGDPCKYLHEGTEMPCPSGLSWNSAICQCSDDPIHRATCTVTVETCELKYKSALSNVGEWGFSSENYVWTSNQQASDGTKVTSDGQHAIFANGAYLQIDFYQNNEYKDFKGEISVEKTGDNEQVIFTNNCKDDTQDAGLAFTVTISSDGVKLYSRMQTTTDVIAPFPNGYQNQVKVTLSTDADSFATVMLQDLVTGQTSTSSTTLQIGKWSTCALAIGGSTANFDPFTGTAQDLVINECQA